MKAGIVCGIVIIAAAVLVWQQHQAGVAAREENRALRQEVEALNAENARLTNQVAQAAEKMPAANSQERELLRLRNEVGALKRQLAEAARAAQAKTQTAQLPVAAPPSEQQDALREMGIAKMNFAKGWVLALVSYAQQHGGQFPPDFESAAPYVPEGLNIETNQATTAQFEITYKGTLNELTNPQSIIVIREREAWGQTADGGWVRGYGFADGHSEIHKAADGNFQPWEAQHMVGAAGQGQQGQ